MKSFYSLLASGSLGFAAGSLILAVLLSFAFAPACIVAIVLSACFDELAGNL